MRLIAVPSDQAAHLPLVWGWLQKAIERSGDWTFAELFNGIFDGQFVMWVAADDGGNLRAVGVTQLTEPPRTCNVLAVGGNAEGKWPELMAQIESYARSEGCVRLRLSGRKGWARVLHDFHQPYIILQKAI